MEMKKVKIHFQLMCNQEGWIDPAGGDTHHKIYFRKTEVMQGFTDLPEAEGKFFL
jgi:hypothetical protein